MTTATVDEATSSIVNIMTRAWTDRTDELTEWTLKFLPHRTDAWGQYRPLRTRKGPKDTAYTAKGTLTPAIVARHFVGKDHGHLIGLHFICADNTTTAVAWDIDAHGSNTEERAARNWRYGRAIVSKLEALGLRPLLIDSNGKGGLHIIVVFNSPLSAARVYQFAQQIISDHAAFGLVEKPETFPKQDGVGPDDYGNWLRLFGRHHTEDHWTRVWDGEYWRSGNDAIDLIVGHAPDDATLIPDVPTPVEATAPQRKQNPDHRRDAERDRQVALDALEHLPNNDESYETWFQVMAACHHTGLSVEDFMRWSNKSGKHNEEKCRTDWEYLKTNRSKVVTLGTLVKLSREAGYDPAPKREQVDDGFRTDDPEDQDGGNAPNLDDLGNNSGTDLPTFELTEVGMSERVRAMWGKRFRYVPALHKFIVWDCIRWKIDDDGAIDRIVMRTVRATKKRAAEIRGDPGEALFKHAHSCETNSKVKAIIERLSKLPRVAIDIEKLDADPLLLNLDNGTVDLRTGQLKPHDSKNFITKLAPVDYCPDADCPLWLAVLDTIMDKREALIRFLQRVGGYSLTGDTSERSMFIPWGCGANGKSTMLHAWGEILGDYATTLPAESLMVRRDNSIPNDIARLKGARFVCAIESEEGRRLAESVVKQMTGGTDLLTGRFLYGEFFSYRPQFKLFMGTNHKPNVRGTDPAIWDRIKLIPFNVRIPENQRDRALPEKLRAEYPGILAWMLRGCLEWQRHGLQVPEEVQKATSNYREDMDVLGAFISDCCLLDPQCAAGATPLFEHYKTWCALHNEEAMTQRRFGGQLAERGLVSDRDPSTRRMQWRGIGILDSAQRSEGTEPNS